MAGVAAQPRSRPPGFPLSAESAMRSQRCLLPGVALAFVWLESGQGDLLACGWQRPDDPLDLSPLRDIPTADRSPPAFDPADYARDPTKWRATPAVPPGTEHARRVWAALSAIPVGEVRTYAQIASQIGSAPRAVGQACRTNPWPLFIPCHRVVSARHRGTRDIGGYAGDQDGPLADVKRALLVHEGVLQLG